MREEFWKRPQVVRILVIGAAALMVLVLAAVGTATAFLPACEGCHFREPGFEAPTASTSHASAGLSCTDCHVETDRILARSEFGLYQVFGMWLPVLDPAVSDAVAIKDTRCLACHEDVLDRLVEVRGMRIVHADCSVGRTCIDCHSEVGHAEATSWPRVSSMTDCTSCHRTESVSLECETCHVGKMQPTRYAEPEFSITHGPTWRETHGMGQMSSCTVCHQEDACSRCHGPGVPHAATFLNEHSDFAQNESAQCQSCHDKAFCDSCHLMEMPHPASFVPEHSNIVESDGEGTCLRCHSSDDCDTCHLKHVHPGGAVGAIPAPSRSSD